MSSDSSKPRNELKKLARRLAKAWTTSREDYPFLRDDALTVLEQAYELGRKAKKP